MCWRLPAIFQGTDETFLWLPLTEDILRVHIVGMELNFNVLPDDATCFMEGDAV
jgi:hypothetical protein